MLEFKTLEHISVAQITEVFNLAFSDYSLPIVLKEDQLENKFSTEGGRLDLSVGVFENGSLVGFILHFMNIKNGKTYVYNGGTGVIPSHRGKRFTSKMYDFILPILKEARVDNLILEVFTDNHSASKVYQNQGFQIQREVACFSGQLVPNDIKLDDEYRLIELKKPNWDQLSYLWDYPPTWQNSISTLKNMLDELLFLGIKREGQILAYAIFNPKRKRINQFSISAEHQNKGLENALLSAIHDLEKEKISFINVDTRSHVLIDYLKNRGLKNYVNQFEMEMALV